MIMIIMAIFAGHIRHFWLRWVLKTQKMESPRLKTPILTLISYLYAHRERFWSRGAKFGLFFGKKHLKEGGVPISPPEKLERSVRGQNRGFLARRVHF